VVSARGCSSSRTTLGGPFRCGTSTGTISPAKCPAAMAAAARCWLASANASWSSRDTPNSSATISAVSPRETVHSRGIFGLTNRHPSSESAISGTPRGGVSVGFSITHGARDMLSTPPATNTSPSPAQMAWKAERTACSPEPQRRFTVCPATETGIPASSHAMRATLRLSSPAWLAHPKITSSTASGATPVRSTIAFTTMAARSSGRTEARAPP
jgi:hypothetical protein